MASAKKYFHDHTVLLLLSVSAFVAAALSIYMLVKLGIGHSGSFIVQCRDCSNPNAINRFSTGGLSNLIAFIGFAIIVVAAHATLSLKAYRVHRPLAIAILALGIILPILAAIISNALLVLR